MRFLSLVLVTLSLVTACSRKPEYIRTLELARSNTDHAESKRLAKLALQQADSAGAVCNMQYDYIIDLIIQNPNFSLVEREAALKHSVDVLRRDKKCLDHDKVLFRRVQQLGDFYYSQKQFDKAEKPLAEALELGIKLRGADDKELAGIRDDSGPNTPISYPSSHYAALANAYEQQGKYLIAEPLRRRDLALHEKYFGQLGDQGTFGEQGGVREQIRALAKNLTFQNKYEEAERLYLRSIEVAKHEVGTRIKESLSRFCSNEHAGLAEIYRRQGNTKKAEENFEKAMLGFDGYGNAPARTEMQLNYAQLLKDSGRGERAKAMEEAVAREKEFSERR